MGTYDTRRPVGDAGRGKHRGNYGYVGGRHRKDGCLSAVVMIVGAAGVIIGGIGYGVVELANALI